MGLLEYLPKEDFTIIQKYIEKFAIKGDINVYDWLKYWDRANKKLYRLLGNQFIYKIPYSQEKDSVIIQQEIQDSLFSKPFKDIYRRFIIKYEKALGDLTSSFTSLVNVETFYNDKVEYPIKMRKAGARKTLQIQAGMKPIRALQKIIEYFPEEFEKVTQNYNKITRKEERVVDYKNAFEDFRITHSMIFNDKILKGNLCLSIHPMDFMTMSDNASDWSSCMSWKEKGCYRIGSVEMMNSNNVLCCYLESTTNPFVFTREGNKEYKWNNKKWRTLVYYTNDIIMSGKAYPYSNDNMAVKLITILRQLAKENLNRTFAFGPELYKDMIHINNYSQMTQNYEWMWSYNSTKHNIIWDTNGMYNDMVNDNEIKYWCVRNKVKHNKIYQVSGKAPCLCCGEPVPFFDEDATDYNDRYSNVDDLICYDCYQANTCTGCGKIELNQPLKHHYCSSCFEEKIKYCPNCHKPMNIFYLTSTNYYIKNKNASFKNPIIVNLPTIINNDVSNKDDIFEPLFVCDNCLKETMEKYKNIKRHLVSRSWSTCIFPISEEIEKYKYKNLEKVPFDLEEEIII